MRCLVCTPFVLTLLFLIGLTVVMIPPALAQTFTVLHNFSGGADGGYLYAGLAFDRAGNLYGTTAYGGNTGENCSVSPPGCGTVFRLRQSGPGWVLNPIYTFAGGSDGSNPAAAVLIGPDGSLYGTTNGGGGACLGGCGTVFNLRPPATVCKTALCTWTETVLHRFTGGADGANPAGNLIFDQIGNVYGTTGGGNGTVYQLIRSGGGWTKSVLYTFNGSEPRGVIFDRPGNLYGTTLLGGNDNNGTVYKLTPSGAGWAENSLYVFQGGSDGRLPAGGLIFDTSGNLYGTAEGGGLGGGTVYMLTPSSGTWIFSTIYSFTDNGNPAADLVMDAAGALYGTTANGGAYGYGSVFKLTPSSGGGWTYTLLHSFMGPDGSEPLCGLVFDANGNLYGTTYAGGAFDYGVAFEITP
jgi:uncharacterized repeat protein (TIGR03803 family)